jgi:hypothetical protein
VWPHLAPEVEARWSAFRARPGVRRARAALRLHRKTIVAVALGVGILLMIFHWS